MWQFRSTNRSEIKPILCDIESRSLDFFSFSLAHVYREANLAAHTCAKEASDFKQKLWIFARIVHDGCIWINDE
jgi:hypothetical protein